eukprot:TRINITY_DN6714_c0_g1_i1.p1 TRINITY_DN6714_c0_g1~~TRINITY_DN6714_c0_g1_i1.p1  ORF type:complete len:278 (+),score=71.89 TRINITY_DN6714_c0_g1_i1:154-987(+)
MRRMQSLAQNSGRNTKVRKIFLVRHGETNYNAQNRVQGRGINSELNERGIQQAELLAKRLSKEPVDFIATSTLTRAHQTASIILKEINNMKSSRPTQQSQEVVATAAAIEQNIEREEADLQRALELAAFKELEEMDFGEMEGSSFDPNHPETVYPALQKIIQGWSQGLLDTATAAAPGGETPTQVAKRSLSAIEQMLKKGFSCGVVVCHGRLLKVLLCSLLKMPLQDMHKIDQNNCAVNILEFEMEETENGEKVKSISIEDVNFTPVKLNCTEHLTS